MKIAFLNKYQDKVQRGAETYVSELSKRLSVKHDVDVIGNINYWRLLITRYDLIIPTNGRAQAFLVRLITWLRGEKMIISGQSGVGLDDRLNLYSFPNYFVALSNKALKWAKRINPLVRSIYIPNGVDLNVFTPKQKKHTTKTILAVGAFTEQKRLDLVIKAASKLDGIRLIIAGGGGELKEELTKLGLDLLGKDRFEIISVSHDEMPALYRKADVFTLSSLPTESFGIVLVEAMASGLPVVATDDPIRREIVGNAGLFVDPTDTDQYAKVLQKALDTNWKDLPRRQAEKFSWDKIAKEYDKLFKQLT